MTTDYDFATATTFHPDALNAEPHEVIDHVRILPLDDEWFSEASIARHLAAKRWGDHRGVPRCQTCGRKLWQSTQRPRMFGCSRHPEQRRSVTAGTFLAHTKLELWVVVQIIAYLLRDDAPSARHLARLLEINRKTAFLWRQKVMAAIGQQGDPIVGFVTLARELVPTCGVNPQAPVPHEDAEPTVAQLVGRHVRRWPIAMWADNLGGSIHGSAAPSPTKELQRLLQTEKTPMTSLAGRSTWHRVSIAKREIKHTHLGVSLRWMARYVQYIAQRPGLHHEEVLGWMLAMPPLPLHVLRPGGAPHHVLDDHFLPKVGDIAFFECE